MLRLLSVCFDTQHLSRPPFYNMQILGRKLPQSFPVAKK
uniref:Uncharacterized protein n=1 Tax=Rhizophora mucronata TaxID=61149 RepID=A0A2P2PV12_RHIMU